MLATLCTTALPGVVLLAGPVPGVESFDKRPVEFNVPPSTTVWSIGDDEYLVTFKWKPDSAVQKPGVAGSFNKWDRADLPMEDPDGDGEFTVTARITGGEHEYKFVSGTEGWHRDPLNTTKREDTFGGDNSILRLGLIAMLEGREAKAGDGHIEWRAFLHNPDLFTYFDPLSDDVFTLRCRTLRGDVAGASVKWLFRDGRTERVPMHSVGGDRLYDFWELQASASPEGLVGYRFLLHDSFGTEEIGRDSWPLVLDPARRSITPEWPRHAIWYQIMVDRFRDGDQKNNPEFTTGTQRVTLTHPWNSEWYTEQPYERENGQTFWKWSMYNRLYGGDFAGVIEKLDYLQELGVTAIYLNPVFEATNSHKYNARSYVHADDGYGTPGEFARSTAEGKDLKDPTSWEFNASDKKLLELINEVKKRNMRIVFDGVFNHLGSDAPSFQDVVANGKNSRYADWYDVTSWEPFEYRGWAGFDGLPQFAKDPVHGLRSESLRAHIAAVTRRWMDPNGDGDPSDGIDGWRLDVPMDVPKPFWVEWRKLVKSINPDAYIVGEIWDPAEEWLDGTAFDAVMNYQFSKIVFQWAGNVTRKSTATEFVRALGHLRARYPLANTLTLQNLYDSHDTDRWVSRLANPDMSYDAGNRIQDEGVNYNDDRPGPQHYQRMRLMAVLQNTYIGAPMIWYGTEIGMFGADDPHCRMPIWWEDKGPFENPEYRIDEGIRTFFRELFQLRTAHPVLRVGEFQVLLTDDAKDVVAFLRWSADEKEAFAVILNGSNSAQSVRIPAPDAHALPNGYVQHPDALSYPSLTAFSGGATIRIEQGNLVLDQLPAASALVVRLTR
jgi:glycosidase